MGEHRRESDSESWLSKNGLSLLTIVGTVVVTIITVSVLFDRTVQKVNAYEPRIAKCETFCEQMPALNGKMDVIIALLDPQGEKRKRMRP